jgi:hypothetical protein
MGWPHFQPTVTVCDVLDAGACLEGVKKFIANTHGNPIAGGISEHRDRDGFIANAAHADGSGYGYGSGDGSGSGSGSGSGYGYGSGDGSGYGYGSGDGFEE